MTLHEQQKVLLDYYNPTEPVIDPASLKGRKQELDEARLFLLNGECIIVQGARRIGKTSFLHCLKALSSEQGQHCLYISFQRLSRYNVSTFVEHLQLQIVSQFESFDHSLAKPAELFDFLGQLGKRIAHAYKPDEYVILFFDEFQLTEDFSEDERRVLYNQLRNVIDERVNYPELRRFVFVLSTAQSLSELTVGISSSLASAFSKTFHLGRISSQSCRELIRDPFAKVLEIEDDIIEFITYETGGHPYLIKLLLHDIIIRNNLFSDSVNFRELVNRQVFELTENLKHDHFLMLKNLLSEVETRILYEIDRHQKSGFLDIQQAIFSFFKQFDKRYQISSIQTSLDHLQNLQILRKQNELFCFASGIYQKWFSGFFEQYYVNEAIEEFRNVAPNNIVLEIPPISSAQEFIRILHEALLSLKTVFEKQGLWELAWKDKNRGLAHHERYLQKMTAALLDSYLAPYNIIVEREVESGVGPMDMKLSLNRNLAACLEIKKSTGDVYYGLETEMIEYMGTTLNIGFFVLFYVGGGTTLATMMNKLDSIVQKISSAQPDKVLKKICIDCLPKSSASKKETRKDNTSQKRT